MNKVIEHYDDNAEHYFSLYNSTTSESVHTEWKHLLADTTPGYALDIGAGSGRDAQWLHLKGWKVTATEPATILRHLAEQVTSESIAWCASTLPSLDGLPSSPDYYDLILLSAVWMHIPPASRDASLRRLASLLSPTGKIIISLRIGPNDPKRPMYPVSELELKNLVKNTKLNISMASKSSNKDTLNRTDIEWKTVIISSVR